jgi:ElaB/YqjD/DUF883 family membrane-anchored ribosome-binding protein
MSPRERKAEEQEKQVAKAGEEAAQAVKDRTGEGDKPPSDPEELREEIKETREELGDTVEALAEKADVKAQAKEKIGDVTQQVQERPARVGAIGGGICLLLLLVWLKRRR